MKIIFYIIAGLYGFLFSYVLLKVIKFLFSKLIKSGKYNPLVAIPVMFVAAVVLFLPALAGLIYFAISFAVAVITNLIFLFVSYKGTKA